MFMVDADADFGRDRHVGRVAHLDHTLDDLTEQVRLPWQRGATAATGHFGYGATEIEVDMVGHVLINDDFRGLLHDRGIHAVQLQRTDLLAGRETAKPQRFRIAGHQCARGDHFRHIQAVGAVAFANHAERPVSDARHRRKHHRRFDVYRPQIDGLHNRRNRRSLRVGTRVEHVGFLVGIHNAIWHRSDCSVFGLFGTADQYSPPASAILTDSGHASPPISTGICGTLTRFSPIRSAM